MPSQPSIIVVLGTGGTISARAESAADNVAYRTGAVTVAELATASAALAGIAVESEPVAQIDSKDMDFATWRALAGRVAWHAARPEVAGVVVTHGTDTVEETAWFLQRALAPAKPVVLTAAMRPASSAQSDGPQNLADALCIAADARSGGVAVVLAGTVHSARAVRKVHPYRLDALGSGDGGPLAYVEEGRLRRLRDAGPSAAAIGLDALPEDPAQWPFVAIVASGAGADARSVSALVEAGCDGLVVAATGNGTVSRALEPALRDAAARGVAILRSTRCLDGTIVEPSETVPLVAPNRLPSAGGLTPQKARVELIVRLLAGGFRPRRA